VIMGHSWLELSLLTQESEESRSNCFNKYLIINDLVFLQLKGPGLLLFMEQESISTSTVKSLLIVEHLISCFSSFLMGRAIHKFLIAHKQLFTLVLLHIIWKSTNSSVYNMSIIIKPRVPKQLKDFTVFKVRPV